MQNNKNILGTFKKAISKIWSIFLDVNWFIFTEISHILIYFIGLYYTLHLLTNMSEDTTSITNVSFAILASLSALSFTFAKALNGSAEEDKDICIFAGERFFHSCLMLITASIIKYFFLSIKNTVLISKYMYLLSAIKISTGMFVTILFYFALHSGHTGLFVLNKLLWSRFGRRSEWNKFR